MVDGTPGLALFDEAGETRAQLAMVDETTSLALLDAKGDVLWQAPR